MLRSHHNSAGALHAPAGSICHDAMSHLCGSMAVSSAVYTLQSLKFQPSAAAGDLPLPLFTLLKGSMDLALNVTGRSSFRIACLPLGQSCVLTDT